MALHNPKRTAYNHWLDISNEYRWSVCGVITRPLLVLHLSRRGCLYGSPSGLNLVIYYESVT
jgi:hypothetical protein